MKNILIKNIFLEYLSWHFVKVPKDILMAFRNFLLFNFKYFSIFFLLKTLFSPWRKYKESYGRGFDFKRYFETFTFNLTSRILGAIVRLIIILIGLIFEVFIFAAGIIVLLAWVFLFILFIIIFYIGFNFLTVNYILGIVISCIGLSILFFLFNTFVEYKIRETKRKYNLDHNSSIVLSKTNSFARKRKIKKFSEEILLYFLLKNRSKEISFVFNRLNLNILQIERRLEKEILKDDISVGGQKIILKAVEITEKKSKEKVSTGDILISFSKNSSYFQKILIQNELKKEDIENLVCWFEKIEREGRERKSFWEYKNLLKHGFFARDWASGFTITLDNYCTDLRKGIKRHGFEPIIGHEKEIQRTERILERNVSNNVLLIGDSKSARESIIEAVAQKSYLGMSSRSINYKRFLRLNLGALISQVTSYQEIDAILDKCFRETVRAGNVILIIDKLQNFLEPASGLGKVDISGVLSRYLHLSSFQIIGITNFEGLHKIIEKKPGVLSLFEKVEATEVSEKEALRILENYIGFFEKKYKKFITYPALREIVRLCSIHIQDTPFPEKALNILDETMVYVDRFTNSFLVLPEHISHVISEKVEVPIGKVEAVEKEKLLNLEELMHKRIINQEEAVRQTCSALRRSRSGVQERERPIGTFLFLGPTGVGKTETSKALTEIYFGKEEKMIRIDMSEFQSVSDISRLIGSIEQNGLLTTAVREDPFSLILFDEIEKAHPNILNLFLQVLDEGMLTDGVGRKVNFKQTIIIATSNAGAEVIRQDIRENKKMDIIKSELLDYLFRQGMFRPEFINRFDAVVIFKPLTKGNLLDISELMLEKVKRNLLDKGIEFEITEELKEKIVELGYSPVFGAREMRRTIQDKVENTLADSILSNKIKKGDRIKVAPENFEVVII